MITVIEACRIATEYDHRPYVVGINEYDSGYEIATSYSNEIMDVGCEVFIDKENGTASSFFPPDHMDEKFKAIEIPKRYKYK